MSNVHSWRRPRPLSIPRLWRESPLAKRLPARVGVSCVRGHLAAIESRGREKKSKLLTIRGVKFEVFRNVAGGISFGYKQKARRFVFEGAQISNLRTYKFLMSFFVLFFVIR